MGIEREVMELTYSTEGLIAETSGGDWGTVLHCFIFAIKTLSLNEVYWRIIKILRFLIEAKLVVRRDMLMVSKCSISTNYLLSQF